ncbi:MAG: zinc-binding dehydrogenase [Myxococcales bacterium]|nr:zinc-binding dehydrogenase [Myxococcales bacterium]
MDAPARELWFEAPRHVALRRSELPTPPPGSVLVRALASGVSRGTELLLYRGQAPLPFEPTLDAPGTPLYPRRYGYAWVGEIVAGDAALPSGARVFCLAPHGDLHCIQATSARRIPDSIPAPRATLAASLETALTCVWDSEASLGDEVVVLGAGLIGLLTTWLLVRAGARVHVVEPVERRRALALTLGAASVCHPADDNPAGRADVVLEASGDPACLAAAISHAAREATIIVASFYGTRSAPLALGNDFHRRRLKLKSSQVSHIPPARAPRWSLERRFELVCELLADDRLDTLVDAPVPFEEAPAVYAQLDRNPELGLHTVFTY